MDGFRCEQLREGRTNSERIARVITANGIEEEVLVAPEQTDGDFLLLPIVVEEADRVLFELPQESSSGRWRLWISRDKVRGKCTV